MLFREVGLHNVLVCFCFIWDIQNTLCELSAGFWHAVCKVLSANKDYNSCEQNDQTTNVEKYAG